jgi:hypothetical protein
MNTNMKLTRYLLALAMIATLGTLASGCSDDEGNLFGGDDAGSDLSDGTNDTDGGDPVQTSLNCPEPGELPFETQATEFDDPDSVTAFEESDNSSHHSLDLLANPGDQQVVEGKLQVVKGVIFPNTQGIFQIGGEFVSIWTYRDGDWVELGRTRTEEDGTYSVELDSDVQFGEGTHEFYTIIEGNQTCFRQIAAIWPEDTKFVISDIDGTLTTSDNEFIFQLGDVTYDPEEEQGASEMMNAWFDKGYQTIYLTARPNDGRLLTRQWLIDHDFPKGPLETADSFVFGSSAAAYKGAFSTLITDDLGWEFTAGYGNSESDIDGYREAGVALELMFTIGEAAGYLGTTVITNDNYTPHISSYVDIQPDVEDPVENR